MSSEGSRRAPISLGRAVSTIDSPLMQAVVGRDSKIGGYAGPDVWGGVSPIIGARSMSVLEPPVEVVDLPLAARLL